VKHARCISLLIVAMTMLGGCTLHLAQVRENNVIDTARYAAIELGQDRRSDVMASLGPPDRIVYARSVLIFDYLWMRHRGTDTRLFVPSEVLPGFDPLFLLSIPRFFFDPSENPEEFEKSYVERIAEGLARITASIIPFASGQDLLIAKGHQLRNDRVRVVFDLESLVVLGKSLRFASGEYNEESLVDRILLRAD
jgi:hypothetical protein